MPTLGEFLPKLLAANGFDTVFGIPGVHTVELYRGMEQTGLTHITPRHEQGAGFMADGYARVTGKPAACFIISGPGMTNITTALGQAYADSIPMLVISSVLNRSELARGEGRLHELKDQRALVEGVCEFSHTVMRADDLKPVLARALAVFHSARPRPVHIEIPLDVIVEAAGHLDVETVAVPAKPAPDADAVADIAARLAAAENPLVILGGGCVGAPDAMRDMVEKIGAPVITTINAKGLLGAGNPHLIGSYLPQPPALRALKSADVVLALGTELGETDTLIFGGYPEIDGHLIRVDIDPAQFSRNANADTAVLADAGGFARALSSVMTADNNRSERGAKRAADIAASCVADIPEPYRMHGALFDALAQKWPELIIAGDSTQPVYGANLTYHTPAPRGWFNSSTGYGTLGYGLPAAIGAKIARPETPVIGVIGDGGVQFSLPELAAAREINLSIPILLWNNQGYGEIKTYMRDRGIPEIGVDIYTPDFEQIAKGFGGAYAKPDGIKALFAALDTAFAHNGPTVIEITDPDVLHWDLLNGSRHD